MPSIFSQIVAGEIPAYKIAENERFFAFLDIRPVARGHTLIVTKIEVDYFFDLDDDHLREINLFAKKVAKKIQQVVPCLRIGMAVVGLEVPHVHVHLIPLNSMEDINFSKPPIKMSSDELHTLAEAIRNA